MTQAAAASIVIAASSRSEARINGLQLHGELRHIRITDGRFRPNHTSANRRRCPPQRAWRWAYAASNIRATSTAR